MIYRRHNLDYYCAFIKSISESHCSDNRHFYLVFLILTPHISQRNKCLEYAAPIMNEMMINLLTLIANATSSSNGGYYNLTSCMVISSYFRQYIIYFYYLLRSCLLTFASIGIKSSTSPSILNSFTFFSDSAYLALDSMSLNHSPITATPTS